MIEQGRKIIHAYAIGTLVDHVHPDDGRTLTNLDGRKLFYKPLEHQHFVDTDSLEAVHHADIAQFGPNGVTYWNQQKLAA